MENEYLIAMNLGGISNRIKCLVSMQRLGKEYDRKVLLYWPLNHTCGAKFFNLFQNKIEEIDEKYLENIKNEDLKYYSDNPITIENSIKDYIATGSWRFTLIPIEFQKHQELKEEGIDLGFDVPTEIKESILKYLKALKPQKFLQDEIDNFQDISDCIGVHIRRGDFVDRPVSPGRVSTDEMFIKRMHEFDEKIKFFLSTDSPEMEIKIENEFPGRIIKYKKNVFTRTDIRATQEGLIDLYLLAKTKHILGTYRSSFTEMAWWLGECKAKVEIMVDLDKEQEYLKNVKKEDNKIIPKIKRMLLKISGRRFI